MISDKFTVSVPAIFSGCFPKMNSFWPEKTSKMPLPLKTAMRGLNSLILRINFSAPATNITTCCLRPSTKLPVMFVSD